MPDTTNNAMNVSTGRPKLTGSIYRAPLNTTLPTDATTALGSAFVCLGHVSEDGLENENSLDFNEIKAWGGAIVYRSLTEMQDNFSFKLIESMNPSVLKAVYGDSNVTIVSGSGSVAPIGGDTYIVDVKAEDPVEGVWVFELAMRGGKKKRIVIPDGAVTERETIAYNDSDAIAYGVTVSAYPDSNGSTHKEYIA